MLSTKLYNRALNLAAENHKRAVCHGDMQEAEHQLDLMGRIIRYGHQNGLALDTFSRRGGGRVGLCFRRNGYRPDMLHIEIE